MLKKKYNFLWFIYLISVLDLKCGSRYDLCRRLPLRVRCSNNSFLNFLSLTLTVMLTKFIPFQQTHCQFHGKCFTCFPLMQPIFPVVSFYEFVTQHIFLSFSANVTFLCCPPYVWPQTALFVNLHLFLLFSHWS